MNIFKNKELERLNQMRMDQQDYEMSLGLATSNEAAVDEQSVLARQEAMVQLSQWQQNRSPAMQRLFLNLAGCTYNAKEKKIDAVLWNKGLVNIWGAKKLTDFAEEHDHNVMLGSYSETYILRTLRDGVAHPLRRYIFNNHRELGILLSNAELVLWEVIYAIEPTYWRGLNDGERRKDKEIIKVQEIRRQNPPEGNKSGFGIRPS